MKVIKKVKRKTNDICVGDQITVKLSGFGKFTATAQKVTDSEVLFLFDGVIARHCMNETNTNEGGFGQSDMRCWLYESVLPVFPKKLRDRIRDITLPTYGEIFGHDKFYENFEPDNNKQFDLMKCRGNRVCDFEGDWCWWWLRTSTKEETSVAYFASVTDNGYETCSSASHPLGVRPEFVLFK